MNPEPEPLVTLYHKPGKGRWKRIGEARGYMAALVLGEVRGLHGGCWWLSTKTRQADADEADEEGEREAA